MMGRFFLTPTVDENRMSKTAEADDRGRIVIPHEIREKYGNRYRIVELADRVELIPLKKDPIDGLRDVVGDAFDGKTISEIKQEARDAARKDVTNEGTRSED